MFAKYFNKIILPIVVITNLLFNYQCQEPYEIKDLDDSLEIPVFNGKITNVSSLNNFALSYATPFGTNINKRISGATIIIYENDSPFLELVEEYAGRYIMPENSPDLSFNSSYMVEIILPNGEVIKSEPMTLLDTITVTNSYIKEGLRTQLIKNESGNYNEVSEYGVFVYADIEEPSKNTYLRSISDYYVHSQKWYSTKLKSYESKGDTLITYTIKIDSLFDIYEGGSNSEFPQISSYIEGVSYTREELEQNPLFLVADEACYDFSLYTDNTFIEWVVPVDIYNHEKIVYDYYVAAKKQLETENQIYDPIPYQILGNLYNSSYPEKTVLGLLDVSSVNRKYMSIYPYHGVGVDYYEKRFLYDTIISSGSYFNQQLIDTIAIDTTIVNK